MAKVMPNLDQQGTKALNLTVLQRLDPTILDILFTAAHVAFYDFNIQLNQWSRKDVEGSLFVVRRNIDPWFQFIVMNRRNTDNLVECILGDFEYEVQVPYLLYKNASHEVNGIWFYNKAECEEVANLFNRIIDSVRRAPPKPLASSKSEFKELEPSPSMAVMEGPLEPLHSSSATVVTDSTSFVDFFNAATNLSKNASNSEKPLQNHHPTSTMLTSSVGPSTSLPIPLSSHQAHSTVATVPSIPLVHQPDVSDPMNRSHVIITNLVKPSDVSAYFPPHSLSSSVPITSASTSAQTIISHSSNNMQSPYYGAPLLQPFPPPAPSSSLTPNTASIPYYGPAIEREKVRRALLTLAQDNQFIDMVWNALHQVHNV